MVKCAKGARKDMTSDDQLQLTTQRALEEFDDAGEHPDFDAMGLGQKAIGALDEFIAHWNDKPYMQKGVVAASDPGHHDLQKYAERQIEWAQTERDRVVRLLEKPRD